VPKASSSVVILTTQRGVCDELCSNVTIVFYLYHLVTDDVMKATISIASLPASSECYNAVWK
jgi:hypothetical protein